MDPRRNILPVYDEHIIQASGMMRRDPLPATHHPMDPLPLPVLLENKLASQAAEIEQLTSDNRKLAASHLALRQDLIAAKGEADKLREHMRSIQAEADIQIRILLDKIAKREADTGAGDDIKKELRAAHIEARSLMTAKLELSSKSQQATKELEYSHANIKKLPEMRAELDSLKQEYQRLRKTFEFEKGSNVEKVEQMKILENDLIARVEEVERLRAELLNAEKRASVPIPYGGPYTNTNNLYPPPFRGNGVYADRYGVPYHHTVHGAPMEMMNPYASGGFAAGPQVISGQLGNAAAAANAAWGAMYDTSHTPKSEVDNRELQLASAALKY